MINMFSKSTRLPRLTKPKGFSLASLIAGAMALSLLVPVQTVQADNSGERFSAKIDSSNTAHFCGPTLLCIDAVGTASIPYLGKSIAVYQGTLDFSTIDPTTGCGPNPGTFTITAANGDTLLLTLEGIHCQSTPEAPLGLTSGRYTVTGGTGRFEGATGGGLFKDTQTSSNPDFSGTDTSEFEGLLKLKEGSN